MKIKFNLGWILAIAAAIVLAAMGFMSFYYLFGGQLIWPIIVASCLLILPIVVNMFLVPAKECTKPFYFHKEAIKEATMLSIMVVLFIVSMPLVNHFFTVNGRTDEIASAVADQRNQLEGMQQSYSKHIKAREEDYRIRLREVLENKERDIERFQMFFPNGVNDTLLMVREMHNKISLEGLSDSAPTVYDREEISWWQLPSVMNNVEGISSALEKNYNLMVERDHNFTIDMGENDYWSYAYTSANNMMEKFTKSAGFITSLWTVFSVLIVYFFILLPYIAAERDSRSKGLFVELKKSNEDENYYSPVNSNIGKL